MALTLAEVDDPAARLAFIARAVERQRAESARPSVARKTHKPRTAAMALTASGSPVSAPVRRPKAVKRALSVADLSDDERRRIELAFHEAGHAVAAVALGGVIHSAVVASGRVSGVQGLTTMHEMPIGERAAEIAFSGPWAQARWRAGRRPTQREVWAVLGTTGCRDHREHLSGETGVRGRVEPLLERCWPAIVKVAQQLLRDGEVRHPDVCAALQIPADDNAHHLSLIRSGCAPGSFAVSRAAL
jgi:hypothetical protein